MIRVVFLIRSLNRGGAERELAILARSLDKKLFDITVLTFYPGGHFAGDISESGIPVSAWTKRAGGIWSGFSGG